MAILPILVTFLSLADGPGYTLAWWTVGGGGVTFSEGSGYSLGGTAGQPDANVLSNGNYTLAEASGAAG